MDHLSPSASAPHPQGAGPALSAVQTAEDGMHPDAIPMVDMDGSRKISQSADPGITTGLQRRETVFQRWTRRHAAKVVDNDPGRSRRNSAYLDVDYGDDMMRRRRSSVDMELVAELLEHDQLDTETHGVSELRDGWFDAVFLKARPLDYSKLMKNAEATLPAAFDKSSPLSVRHFFPQQRRQLESVFWRIVTTRAGIKLLKSFSGFFIAYVLCLVPEIRDWLGRYSYIMPVSTIINHAGRPLGAQLDGAVWTILGTISGLGWGALGLLLSYSTLAARLGYGGILALFFLAFIATMAFLRSYFTRFYQFSMCAGIAMCYTLLAEVSGRRINWPKFWAYGVPWVLGQAICFVVNLVYVDAGARPLAETLHRSFTHMQDALEMPRPRNQRLRRALARASVDVGSAYRDLRLDVSITRFEPQDVRSLRNLIQTVIRALLLLKTETRLFEKWDVPGEGTIPVTFTVFGDAATGTIPKIQTDGGENPTEDAALNVDGWLRLISQKLAVPTEGMLFAMKRALSSSDAALMNMSGFRTSLGPAEDVSSDVYQARLILRRAMHRYDHAEEELRRSDDLPLTSLSIQEIAKLLVFAQLIRLAATSIDDLATQVVEMQRTSRSLKISLPSYPLRKAVNNVNAQVRRDRGGQTAGIYKETFREISALMDQLRSKDQGPISRGYDFTQSRPGTPTDETPIPKNSAEAPPRPSKRIRFGYQIWRVLHRLQGFESKYAVKVCLLTGLLAIPGWLQQSRGWWNETESWWAVVMAWLMVHPRIGGNMQDLVARGLCVVLGAVWAGFSYVAHDGNPVVMAAFALVFMIPMMYRFTLSSHPRSGIAGCISFTVISLAMYNGTGQQSPVAMTTVRGLAFLVGTVSAVVINWVLWPFVSRHELRKAISAMIFFMSVVYRNVVAKYVYYEEARVPTPGDVDRSEMIESKLREGFVRIRQLLIMTRHELRLRSPFDPLPYSALADACERFCEHLVSVRQAALKYDAAYVRSNEAAAEKLLPFRRDAVASILSNLYILAGALKADRKVPRYMTSAAAARKRLLDRMAEVEDEMAASGHYERRKPSLFVSRGEEKWNQVYSYAFSESLTGCVAQLEELERYTKLIVGEQGFDDEYKDSDEDSDDDG